MECLLFLILAGAATGVGVWLCRSRSRPVEGHATAALPSYAGVPLEARLADPAWSGPIVAAGFNPTAADLVRAVGPVIGLVHDHRWRGGQPRGAMAGTLSADTAILLVQHRNVGVAVPDGDRVIVAVFDARAAEVGVANSGSLQLRWPGPHGFTEFVMFIGTDARGGDYTFGAELDRLVG
jgi:hypothetical protein